jgi:superfamily I DNA and/or RNA helicase
MLPNKVISVKDSILWKLIKVVDALKSKSMLVLSLWEKASSEFEDINQFIFCLEVLYVLDKIEYSENYKVVEYVG